MKKLVTAVLAAAVLVTVAPTTSQAAEIKISQKGKEFASPAIKGKKLSAAVGDTLVFVNDDAATHNLVSRKGVKFDSGAQDPGAVFPLKLDAAGKFTVRCAIHPRMKLKVEVN